MHHQGAGGRQVGLEGGTPEECAPRNHAQPCHWFRGPGMGTRRRLLSHYRAEPAANSAGHIDFS